MGVTQFGRQLPGVTHAATAARRVRYQVTTGAATWPDRSEVVRLIYRIR